MTLEELDQKHTRSVLQAAAAAKRATADAAALQAGATSAQVRRALHEESENVC